MKAGGLGLRKAEDLALPAFIASRVDARQAVDAFVRDFFGGGLSSAMLTLYDEEVVDVVHSLKNVLPPVAALKVDACLVEARGNQADRGPLRQASDYLIALAGGADPDEGGSLQGSRCGIVDRTNCKEVGESIHDSGRFGPCASFGRVARCFNFT